MSREQIQKLIRLAGEICILTPARRPAHSVNAYVPWRLVLELRTLLTASGLDLELARARMAEEIKRQASSSTGAQA